MASFFEIFIFSLAMCIPPGPINILSAAYGKKNGFLNSIGFMFGAAIGFSILATTLGMGQIRAIEDYPQIVEILKYLGSFYMIFLSVCIIFIGEEVVLEGGVRGRFFDGIFIQWINPKSWVSAISGVSRFNNSHESLAVFISIEFVMCCIGIAVWAYAGERISQVFSSPSQQKVLNVVLAISLASLAATILAN
ncbi:MAG: LysE family translocator [Oligoflexales bacterium]